MQTNKQSLERWLHTKNATNSLLTLWDNRAVHPIIAVLNGVIKSLYRCEASHVERALCSNYHVFRVNEHGTGTLRQSLREPAGLIYGVLSLFHGRQRL